MSKPESPRLVAEWAELRPYVAIGAVFQLSDSIVLPKTKSTKSHPYLIVGGEPAPTDSARIALARFVQLSYRTSYDGTSTKENAELEDFFGPSGIFSRADDLPGLDRDGFFTTARFTVQVRSLTKENFLGFINRETADRVAYRVSGRLTSSPYPPVGAQ